MTEFILTYIVPPYILIVAIYYLSIFIKDRYKSKSKL